MNNIVTLGDASLSTDDLALLVPPAWLNDQLISFWCEHLRIDVARNHPQVTILAPNITFFIALTDDQHELQQIASAHQLHDKQLVLVAVNNGRHTDVSNTPAGSHWSLLIFHRPENSIFYLDSIRRSPNISVSKSLAKRLCRMLAAPSATFVTMAVPAQTNSYDCGAFLCVFAERAVRRFLNHKPIANMFPSDEHMSSDVVDSTRQQIGVLACELFDKLQK